MKLSKGSSIKLSKDDDVLTEVTVGCSWGENNKSIDVDTMAFFLNGNSKSSRLVDYAYYGNRNEIKSFVKHYGDDTTGSNKQHESDNEVIFLKLDKVPNLVTSVAVVINVFSGEKLSKVPNLRCKVYSGEPGDIQDILGVFDITESSSLKSTSVVVGYFNKDDNNEWVFVTSGESLNSHRHQELSQAFNQPMIINQQGNEDISDIQCVISKSKSFLNKLKGLFS